MKSWSHAFALISVVVPALAGCASSGGGGLHAAIAMPEHHSGFPAQAFAGIVFSEARYYVNHKDVFGEDLIEKEGVLPLAMKIGLRGEGQGVAQIRVSPEDMDFCLYLPDGTPLRAVDYQAVKTDRQKTKDRIIQEALKGTLLEAWERSHEGFVFFKLPSDTEYSAKDATVVRKVGDVERKLDLTGSLCTFRVTIQNQLVPFHVGIQRDRRTAAH